jgi:hypothetical protein
MTALINECVDAANVYLEIADKWRNSKYRNVKETSTTAKGNWGQEFTTQLLNKMGYKASVINGGIGDYDIILNSSKIKLEHKLATEDINCSFQFNSIDKDKNYDFVFCLGVGPDDIYFDIKSKGWCIANLTTKMTKAEGGYKLSLPRKKMIELTENNLRNQINKLGKKW